jgi:hypothetical protein
MGDERPEDVEASKIDYEELRQKAYDVNKSGKY